MQICKFVEKPKTCQIGGRDKTNISKVTTFCLMCQIFHNIWNLTKYSCEVLGAIYCTMYRRRVSGRNRSGQACSWGQPAGEKHWAKGIPVWKYDYESCWQCCNLWFTSSWSGQMHSVDRNGVDRKRSVYQKNEAEAETEHKLLFTS